MSSCGSKIDELRNKIPSLNIVLAIIVLCINICIPGVGTMLFICLGGGANWVEHLIIGLLQFFLTILLIGWIWSICWGIFAVMKST